MTDVSSALEGTADAFASDGHWESAAALRLPHCKIVQLEPSITRSGESVE